MKKLLIFTIFIAALYSALAQSPEEEVLKKLALRETDIYWEGNLEGWRALMSQNAKTNRLYSGNGFYVSQVGWKPIDSLMALYNTVPRTKATTSNSDYIIEVSDRLAWMAYNQRTDFENDSLTSTGTREFRTFVKEGNEWKISSLMTIDTLSYAPTTNPQMVENLFNTAGYSFLGENKINEALEIFKLNVTLYPDSWNTYDSLGEAYAASGNKKLAIENYLKSLELNPENDNGREWLSKLKGE
ncbi:tetratricopeptide repeat protein [Pricia sp.]|uniref:tetratricopeptide repeat protein n=1 Tax=Pricia sp. TaxID=2268138 RepID=UPI003593DDD8